MSDMKHSFNFAPEFVGAANIKVVGVGGGGGNAINRMIASELSGVEFIAINTDAQALEHNKAEKRIQIGIDTTDGLGAGANPDIGLAAMQESRKEVFEQLGKPNLVFITAGMGGGTGTGAAPMIAEIAKESGALTVAIVTKPFKFEGRKRIERAEAGLAQLKSKVDTLITIRNERLLEIVDKNTTLTAAFQTADEVLHQATKGISDLITIPGLINCDFADVRTVMSEMGDALMGTGYGEGEEKAIDAAQEAISSPLLESVSIGGARGVLVNITGGEDMALHDVNTATSLIYEKAGDNANVIFGAVIDPNMNGKMRVTVIATGIGSEEPKPAVKEESKVNSVSPGKAMSLFPEETMQAFPLRQTHQTLEKSVPMQAGEPTPNPISVEPIGGNGNGQSIPVRNRVPVFSEDDRTIPAYIRRIENN
ncbi:MAG: cell division protein FtsZ [candidate division Zixibacteria bacterium]|nr:cell division protein FtsZ [candidate division Zixibacteria bacterium]